MGLQFPNPVGLAAGFDKNGEYIDALATLGFGFIEVGTVTPKPQTGNEKPRVFRLPQSQALINRMGFNNKGVDILVTNVKQARFKGVLGINIGKNYDTPLTEAIDDYLVCLRKVYPHSGYIVINVSSPGTPGLRDLQHGHKLHSLLDALKSERRNLLIRYDKYVPLVIKISPDISSEELHSMAHALTRYEIDGVIATNTTTSRDGVENLEHDAEVGGLSGEPLRNRSMAVIKELRASLHESISIIASGGIMKGEDAVEKIKAGASLVQIYTGLVYRGPRLIKEITDALR